MLKVTIVVSDGVAEVEYAPKGVEVEIIDLDNLEAEHDEGAHSDMAFPNCPQCDYLVFKARIQSERERLAL